MEERPMNTAILVALISGIATLFAAIIPALLVQKARKENATDHGKVSSRLDRIDDHIGVVEAEVRNVALGLDTHLLEHKRSELNEHHPRVRDKKE
jgi:uncharacterized protein (DUF3084 family)